MFPLASLRSATVIPSVVATISPRFIIKYSVSPSASDITLLMYISATLFIIAPSSAPVLSSAADGSFTIGAVFTTSISMRTVIVELPSTELPERSLTVSVTIPG